MADHLNPFRTMTFRGTNSQPNQGTFRRMYLRNARSTYPTSSCQTQVRKQVVPAAPILPRSRGRDSLDKVGRQCLQDAVEAIPIRAAQMPEKCASGLLR